MSTDQPRLVVLLATVRWSYLWQRHQSLAAAAATAGPVVFVESQPRRLRQLVGYPLRALTRRRGAGAVATPTPALLRLVRPSPWALLTPRRWAHRQADEIARTAGTRAVDVVLYAPTPAYRRLADRLAERGATVSYDAVVDWSAAPSSWYPPRGVRAAEQRLPADWRVVSDSPALAADLAARLGRPVPVVPPAADAAFLQHVWRPLADREACLGWFGALRSETDTELLRAAAAAGIRVETVGPVEDEAAATRLRAAGVRVLPAVPIDALPAAIGHWRVTVLAYTGSRADTITPAKLLNALVGFRVAVRGIVVPDEFRSAVLELPDDDAEAVRRLAELVDRPGVPAPLATERLDWAGRLADITGAAR